MALSPTASSAANGAQSTSNALSALRVNAKQSADDAGDDFAAQLERAQPQPQPTTAKSDADATDKTSSDDDKSDQDSKDKSATNTGPDAATLLQWAQQHLAQKPDPTVKGDAKAGGDAALGGLLGGARKGAANFSKTALPGATTDANAKAGTAALAGKGDKSATDALAALGKDGAANVASQTQDSMAALVPQPDPTTVQAGSIGASPTAVLDAKAAAEQAAAGTPAQASLPMAPQSPTFAPALGQQLAVWVRQGVQHAEVQLNPQDLGPIRVKIAVEGAATRVEMSADVASTRDALQQAMPQLSDSLGQVGLSLTGGGVSDQSAQSQSQAQFQASGDGGSGASGGRQGQGGGASGGADDGLAELAGAGAARQAATRRGLLDMYA